MISGDAPMSVERRVELERGRVLTLTKNLAAAADRERKVTVIRQWIKQLVEQIENGQQTLPETN